MMKTRFKIGNILHSISIIIIYLWPFFLLLGAITAFGGLRDIVSVDMVGLIAVICIFGCPFLAFIIGFTGNSLCGFYTNKNEN